eukprot:4292956-Alexandrium_andersonii.AAC.1
MDWNVKELSDPDRERPIPPTELRVEVGIPGTEGELDHCSDLQPPQCKITYRPFPRGKREVLSPW